MLAPTFDNAIVLEGGVIVFIMKDGNDTVTIRVTQEALQDIESVIGRDVESFVLGTTARERLENIANQKYEAKNANEDVNTIRITSADVR